MMLPLAWIALSPVAFFFGAFADAIPDSSSGGESSSCPNGAGPGCNTGGSSMLQFQSHDDHLQTNSKDRNLVRWIETFNSMITTNNFQQKAPGRIQVIISKGDLVQGTVALQFRFKGPGTLYFTDIPSFFKSWHLNFTTNNGMRDEQFFVGGAVNDADANRGKFYEPVYMAKAGWKSPNTLSYETIAGYDSENSWNMGNLTFVYVQDNDFTSSDQSSDDKVAFCTCADGQRYVVGCDKGTSCVEGTLSKECQSGNATGTPGTVTCVKPGKTQDWYRNPADESIGGYGGTCTCPSGGQYEVGDNNDNCATLACEGGTSSEKCEKNKKRPGARAKVTCNASVNHYREVDNVGGWGGTCTCPDGQVYKVGDNSDTCGSLACEGGKSSTCTKRHLADRMKMKVTCANKVEKQSIKSYNSRTQTPQPRDMTISAVGDTNVYEHKRGKYVGYCTCPDGRVYKVAGNNVENMGDDKCEGGLAGCTGTGAIKGHCYWEDNWSDAEENNHVTCGGSKSSNEK